jgi:predicted phage terminase large subunit-like protein
MVMMDRRPELSPWEYAARSFESKPRRWAAPGDMAVELDNRMIQTPALRLVDQALLDLADGRDKRLMIFAPPQEGKLVADDTRVPTPDGWVRHGDLRPGSVVFHPSGRQVKVAEVHEPAMASLRVHFSDHTSILVHPAHEWTVWDRKRGRWLTMETRQLAAVPLSSGPPGKRGHWYRFFLPLREALDCPDVDLPVEPYTLGVWLGDGSTTKPAITHHPDDCYEMAYTATARCVHPTTGIITTYYSGQMQRDLREAGVFGNKHIPAAYLRASTRQRRALLAGLIDTDGHVSASGQVSFDNANEGLVRSTAELIRTLGYRAHVHRPTPPKLSSSGIQGKLAMWRVTFTPHDQGPARLERKAAVRLGGARKRTSITAIAAEAPNVGRCITVDTDDGLYLVGEGMLPTHNSERCSRFFPLWTLTQDAGTRVAIVSYSDDIARRWGWQLRLDVETFSGAEDQIDLGLRLYERPAAGYWRVRGTHGSVSCVGIAGSLSGKAVDLLIIDDPHKDLEQANSVKYRERAWRFWQAVAIPRLGPNSKVLLMTTRWHESDLAGKLLETEGDKAAGGKWRVVSIPAQCENPKTDLLGRAEGEYMTSARGRTAKDWEERRKDVGEYVWAALFQQRPAPAEGNLFKRLWWRYWTPAGEHRIYLGGRVADLRDSWRFGTVDLAASTRTSADYTVIAAWARTLAGDLVLLDVTRAQIGEEQHFAQARPLVERWQLDTLFAEASQYGFTLVKEATQSGVPVSPVQAEQDKLSRALPYSAWCSGGRVWLPAGAHWLPTWIDEHAAFPAAAHDDTVDVGSLATRVSITKWAPLLNRAGHATVGGAPDPDPDPFGGNGQVDLETVSF